MNALRRFVISALAISLAGVTWGQAAPAKSAKAASSKSASAAVKEVDINTASAGELIAIPGIGDVYANKIMAGRPYKSKAQLKSRHILPDAVYETTKAYMVAKQK